MTGDRDSLPAVDAVSRATPGPRDRQVLQLLVLALILIAVGVVIGKVIRGVARRAYHPESFEVNLNLA